MVPINDQLLQRRNVRVNFNGVVKAPFSDSASDMGILVEGAGPITEWWITGLNSGEKAHVGISTQLADYYLRTPSAAYSPIHIELGEKVKKRGILSDAECIRCYNICFELFTEMNSS